MHKILLVMAFIFFAPAANAADVKVIQSHMTFDVEDITIKAGDAVDFVNQDDVTHNIQVVDADGAVDDKGLQKPGQDIKETFATAGKYKIMCAIHPKMKLNVVVQ